MNKTQQKLLSRAIENNGKAFIQQSWGRTPNGGFVRGSHKQDLAALQKLVDGGLVTYSRWPTDPMRTINSTFNGYTMFTVEHIYTLTEKGRNAYNSVA